MKDKILILVKTYPTFSKKYHELVCTAGINEKGEWVRIYPVPFRTLPELEQYKKYDYVEVDLIKNNEDPRPESHKLAQDDSIKRLMSIDTKNNWQQRKEIIFSKTPVFNNIETLIQANKQDGTSLAIFKPDSFEFTFEACEEEWSQEILDFIEQQKNMPSLFPELTREIKLVKKLPYKFSYKFTDTNGKTSNLMIADWEIGQLYWNCFKQLQNKEEAAKSVAKKYGETFQSNDIHFFLGTTRQFDGWANNPFIIIGVFYPPKVAQSSLF